MGWWRDWSAKWSAVEPERGKLDFAVPDAQVLRVLELGGEVDVLLPFPSAPWSSTARAKEVEAALGASPLYIVGPDAPPVVASFAP